MEIYFVKLVFDKIQIRILLSKRHIFLFQAVVAFLVSYPFMKRFDLKTYKKEQEEAKQNANA